LIAPFDQEVLHHTGVFTGQDVAVEHRFSDEFLEAHADNDRGFGRNPDRILMMPGSNSLPLTEITSNGFTWMWNGWPLRRRAGNLDFSDRLLCADQELLVLLELHDAVDARRSQSLDHEVGAVGRRKLNLAFVVGIGVGAMTRTLGKLTPSSASRCSSWPSIAIGL
jgi:hypothetical protein